MAKNTAHKNVEKSNEETIKELKDEFSKILSDNNVDQAVLIFSVNDKEEPQVYRKGHFYDSAVLINHVMAAYRAKAAVELGI